MRLSCLELDLGLIFIPLQHNKQYKKSKFDCWCRILVKLVTQIFHMCRYLLISARCVMYLSEHRSDAGLKTQTHSTQPVLCTINAYFSEAKLCPLTKLSTIVKQIKKSHKPSSILSFQQTERKTTLDFVFPQCNLFYSTHPHIRTCNTRYNCYFHFYKRVDLSLDDICMSEQEPKSFTQHYRCIPCFLDTFRPLHTQQNSYCRVHCCGHIIIPNRMDILHGRHGVTVRRISLDSGL